MATAEIDDGIDSFLEAAELYAASGIEKLRPRHMTLGQLIEQNATFSKGSRVVSIFDGTNDPGSICEYFDKDSPMVFMPFQELSLTNPGPSQIISLDFEKRVYLDILAGHYFSWALTPSTDLAKHRADKEFNERAHFVEKTHAILMDAKSKRAPVTVAFIDLGKRDLMGRVGHLLKSRDLIFLDESKWLVEDNQERFTLARIDSL
jgi:hypothetical protein